MKTRTLLSKFFLTVGRLLVVCLFLLQATGVAHADVPVVDGDGAVPVVDNNMSFGSVCKNTTTTKKVMIAIRRNSNNDNTNAKVFGDGAVVTVSALPTTGMFSVNGSGEIRLPVDWVKSKNIISTQTVLLTVAFVAGSVTGTFTDSLNFSAVGPNTSGDEIDRLGSMSVSADVISCDTTPPTINVPGNMTVEAKGPTGTAVEFTVSADDVNPTHPAVTCAPASGSTFPLGNTTVSCSATDNFGNTGSNTFTITVRDTTPPAFGLMDVAPVEATGPSGASVWYTVPAATDLVDGSVDGVTCNPASETTFAIGSTPVTCRATDSHGNLGKTSFNIIVQDKTAPVLSLPVPVEKEATSSAGAVVAYTVSASDVVDGAITPSCKPTSGSTFPIASTSVDCSATDAHSNTANGSFPVNVVDTTPPALTLPASFSAEATSLNGAAVTFTTSAEDLVDNPVSVSCTPAAGSVFPLGATTVNCSAADTRGNKAEGSFNITVVDTTAPELTLPADQKLEATGPNGAKATFSVSAKDAVDSNPTVSCDKEAGATFPLGETTVNCTATDDAGNIAKGAFTILVQDTTAPALTLPSIAKQEATSANGAAVEYTATAIDIVDGTVAPSCSPASGNTFPLGTSTVSCTATDKAGNTASGSFSIEVVDTTPPALTLPANITKEATGPSGAAVDFVASAVDLVDGDRPVTCTPASGTTFGFGETKVTCTSVDTRKNSGEKSFFILVQDTTPPVLTLPANITEEATSPAGAVVSYSATAADIVDGNVNVTCEPPSGSTFAIATSTVNCAAIDKHNNTAKGSFGVTVQDTTPPAIVCETPLAEWSSSDISVKCTASDSASGLANTADASFTLTTHVADSIETDSAATESHTVTDNAGNSAHAGPFEGLMVDKAAPTYTCGAADSIWHNTDVNIACSANDGGSGLSTPAVFNLSTHVNAGEETANAATDGSVVSDKVGHNVTVDPISGNMIDKKAPQLVSCEQPDGIWHAENVTLNCIYSDGGSGPAIQTLALTTAIANGTETNNALASTTSQAQDAVGNAALTPTAISGNWIDRKAPVISIETPAGDYLLNQSVTIKFICTDSGSGVATCDGTQANGAALDTSTVGPHTFTVTSTDSLGNKSEQSVTYTVKYASVGTQCYGQPGHQVLQPINVDGSSVFKKGSTVPVKFRVCDANGNSVSAAGIVTSFTYTYSGSNATEMVNEPVYSTTPDTNFRWSSADQQWIYNLSTKDARFSTTTNGSRYIFTITLNDGSIIPFVVGLK